MADPSQLSFDAHYFCTRLFPSLEGFRIRYHVLPLDSGYFPGTPKMETVQDEDMPAVQGPRFASVKESSDDYCIVSRYFDLAGDIVVVP